MIIIKKYENRRLYNVAEKKYISLKDIEKLVIEKQDFQVIEKKTGNDITKNVLFQVILEMNNEKISAFPIDFLKFMIYSSPETVTDYFGNFFQIQKNLYKKNRDKYMDILKNMMNFESVKKTAMNNPFATMMNQFNPFMQSSSTQDSPLKEEKQEEPKQEAPKEEKKDSADEVADLKKQMGDLLSKLSNLEDKLK